MIIRITFEGIVKSGKKRSILPDHLDIHAASIDGVKEMFLGWVVGAKAIRGDSGIFHPVENGGEIKIKSVKEHND